MPTICNPFTLFRVCIILWFVLDTTCANTPPLRVLLVTCFQVCQDCNAALMWSCWSLLAAAFPDIQCLQVKDMYTDSSKQWNVKVCNSTFSGLAACSKLERLELCHVELAQPLQPSALRAHLPNVRTLQVEPHSSHGNNGYSAHQILIALSPQLHHLSIEYGEKLLSVRPECTQLHNVTCYGLNPTMLRDFNQLHSLAEVHVDDHWPSFDDLDEPLGTGEDPLAADGPPLPWSLTWGSVPDPQTWGDVSFEDLAVLAPLIARLRAFKCLGPNLSIGLMCACVPD